MINKEILERKGARKAQDIPKEVLALLNKGEIPTVNLIEWLAIDQIKLIKSTFPRINLKDRIPSIIKLVKEQKKPSTMSSVKLIGQELHLHCKETNSLAAMIQQLSQQKSDTLRSYAPYLISLNLDTSLSDKLTLARSIVADQHFGVREIVWMALRPAMERKLKESIKILTKWTKDPDENIRRFTTESIRPRGVWCKHIDALKENPEQALPILESLKSDPSKYVQDSLGNWLNDASKSKPAFVIKLCKEWRLNSKTSETEKIIKRALRTLEK